RTCTLLLADGLGEGYGMLGQAGSEKLRVQGKVLWMWWCYLRIDLKSGVYTCAEN
ncbi:hypothetical protein FRX31_029128, partial [Thalictrum thalictroides]